MPLSDHVSLTITQDSVGIARAGFGVPMHLSYSAAWAERIRFYTSLADVAVDFPVTTSPEYLAATAFFSQSPRPNRIAIGRGALKPTQVYTVGVATIRDSHAYQIRVKGQGVTETVATYTSGVGATNDAIIAGLVTQLNAVVGNNYIAAIVAGTGDTDTLTVTADAAGGWFSLEVLSVSDLEIAQTHADPGIATDLAAILLENSDWYALHTAFNSNALVLAAAAWVEANKRIYVVDVNESDAITTTAGNSDTLDDLATLERARTMGCYHPDPSAMFAAAWMGRVLPLEPGSETWKFKRLSGVPAVRMTATQRGNLIARSANSYETIAGINITFEGTTADGDFLDVTRGLDWLEDDMSKGVFGVLAGADKIPFTDAGVALIEAEVRASLRRAVDRQILADDPEPTVTVPLVADVSTSDKALRLLPDVKFSGTLAGAIHKVTISGVVSV